MVNRPGLSAAASAFLFLFVSGVAGCGDGARVFGGGGSGTGGDPTLGDAGVAGTSGTGGRLGGTGGVTGSGGLVGTGGSKGTGGMTGTGGTGGTGGSGGIPGSGGVSGTGGRAATGGTTGTGGAPGTGGTGGANPSTCSSIAASYANEMRNAKVCALASLAPQCQTRVSASLGCGSNCFTFVENATNLHQISNNWQAAGCDSTVIFCPAIACVAAQQGTCVPSMATTAMCQDSSGPTQ